MTHLKPNSKRPARNGITLMFVMTMLVLFLLLATTFVVVSSDFMRSSRKRSHKHLFPDDHEALLETAFYEVFRGPDLSDSNSPLRGHSILADIYGYGLTATVESAVADSSEHFIKLTLNNDATTIIDGAPDDLGHYPGSMNGLVMSVVSGPAKGLSTRIVDHQVSGAGPFTHTFILLPSRIENSFNVANASAIDGSRVVINQRPFSGTGAGQYNPLSARGTAALTMTALQPNQIGRSRDDLLGGSGDGYFSIQTSSGVISNSLGPNESWDTFDYQNMFLAGLRSNGDVEAASFYRSELVAGGPDPIRADFRAFKSGGPADDGIMVDNNNDGIPEGIWMDTNLPVRATPDGHWIKPLVSYTILDMGGRINVNAHGSWKTGDGVARAMIEIPLLATPGTLHYGQGYGPPEINPTKVVGAFATGLMTERYGPDSQPGRPGVRDGWSAYKLYGYPDAIFGQPVPGTVDGYFGTAMDIHGRFATGYPQIFDLSDDTFPIGMPVANVGRSLLSNEIVDSAYEMSFVTSPFSGPGNQGWDTPFTPQELEGAFRRADPDSSLLQHRLRDALPTNAINSITTASFEVPTVYENLSIKLYKILENGGLSDAATIRAEIYKMLPPEVLRGLPMNVNRPFGDGEDNNGNGLVDERGEVDRITYPTGQQLPFDYDNDSDTSSDPNSSLARANFAKQLYIVTLLATEKYDRNGDGAFDASDWYDFNDDGTTNQDDLIAYRRVVAQWAVNVVDFRDTDSIMTPFEFDLNPWNGWDVDGRLSTTETLLEGSPQQEMRAVVWGAERPELLITETLVTHDRRTQDLANERLLTGGTPGRYVDGEDNDFDSFLVPKVSAFFELYNPWVMNDANQIRPGEFYDNNRDGVDLQKMAPDGLTPIWRLIVTETGDEDLDPDDPTNNPAATPTPTVIRRIYFKRPDFTVDSGPEVYFPDDDIQAGVVGPGRFAVVGTAGIKVDDRYDTYFGRRNGLDALDSTVLHDQTRRISLDPANRELHFLRAVDNSGTIEFETETRSVVTLPIGLNDGGWERELGVSDPLDGYYDRPEYAAYGFPVDLEPIEDGFKFTEDITTPGAPTDFVFDEPVDRIIDENHYTNFLAENGLQPGYKTVHLQRLASPLRSFNAQTNPYLTIDSSSLDLFVFNGVDSSTDPLGGDGIMRLGTYERRSDTDSPLGQDMGHHRLLFKNDRLGRQNAEEDATYAFNGTDFHHLSWNLVESLGKLNQAFIDAEASDPKPFCWLTWNNRPYVSELELANVPHTSSYWMTRLFDKPDPSRGDIYSPPLDEQPGTEARNYTAHFPHLLNFYSDRTEAGSNGLSLHRIFDYLEVPSRFVGTESYVNPITFEDNAHGVTHGLAAPFDSISHYRYPGKININTILDARTWNCLMGGYETEVSYSNWESSREGSSPYTNYANPYRSAKSNNMVPPGGSSVVDPVECGLFRKATPGSDDPLFDFAPATTVPHADGDRAAYFKYAMRQRLGNLVTTRSSVFAVWITIGFFEVNSDGSLKLGPGGTGAEAGAEAGEVKRHRGFYLLDRSIPVAFEPGKNHNVDRAVLVKTIIE